MLLASLLLYFTCAMNFRNTASLLQIVTFGLKTCSHRCVSCCSFLQGVGRQGEQGAFKPDFLLVWLCTERPTFPSWSLSNNQEQFLQSQFSPLELLHKNQARKYFNRNSKQVPLNNMRGLRRLLGTKVYLSIAMAHLVMNW